MWMSCNKPSHIFHQRNFLYVAAEWKYRPWSLLNFYKKIAVEGARYIQYIFSSFGPFYIFVFSVFFSVFWGTNRIRHVPLLLRVADVEGRETIVLRLKKRRSLVLFQSQPSDFAQKHESNFKGNVIP